MKALAVLLFGFITFSATQGESKEFYKYDGMQEEEPLTVQEAVYIPSTPAKLWFQRKVMAEIEKEMAAEETSRNPAETH